uniref:Uncharacterized protein n=1 Tax=Romanomermis culicivorax TaxID=13658 RepID=A0A915I0P6_ROMCU
MTTPSTSSVSTTDEPPMYRELINVKERYIRWAEQQPHQNNLSFCCDSTFYFTTFFALLLHALSAWDHMGALPSLCSPAPEPMVSCGDPVIVKLWQLLRHNWPLL